MKNETLEFTTKVNEIPFTVDGVKYVITEMNGEEYENYLEIVTGKTEVIKNEEGKTAARMKTMIGSQTDYLVHCVKDSNGKRVDQKTIASWPVPVLRALAEKARELNKTEDPEAEEEAKKD